VVIRSTTWEPESNHFHDVGNFIRLALSSSPGTSIAVWLSGKCKLFDGRKLPFDWVGDGTATTDLGFFYLTSNRRRVASAVTGGAFPLLPGETECVK